MKIATPFKIFSKFLIALKNKKMLVKNINDKSLKYSYWDKECLEHPTNNSCLIYCE